MSQVPVEVQALVQAALAARALPTGGEALWELYAHAGALVLDGQAVTRERASKAAFVRSHQAAVEGLRAAGSGFPDGGAPVFGPWQADADGVRGLLHLEQADARRDAPVHAVFGVIREQDAWRIAFAGVGDGEPVADFARWQAGTLADFTYLPGQLALPSRDWLDVGYRRRFRLPRPTLLLPAELKFGCRGTASCCNTFEIVEEAPAQAFVDALPVEVFGAEVQRVLEPMADGRLRLKRAGERCRFLDEESRCRIHARLGTPVFPACVLFPFHFAETPAGVAVSASLHCSSVQQNVGPAVDERLDDLYGRLAVTGMRRQPTQLRLGPEQPVELGVYEAASAAIAHALAWPVPDAHRRLWMALRALEAHLAGQEPDWETLAREPILPLDEPTHAEVRAGLGQLLGCVTAAKPVLGLAVPPTAYAPVADEAALTRWLGLVHQARDLAYGLDLATATNALVLTDALARALSAAHGAHDVPALAWAELGGFVSHQSLARLLTALTVDNPQTRRLLGNPALGLLQLRALARDAACAPPGALTL